MYTLTHEYPALSYQFVSEVSLRTSAIASFTSWEILTPRKKTYETAMTSANAADGVRYPGFYCERNLFFHDPRYQRSTILWFREYRRIQTSAMK